MKSQVVFHNKKLVSAFTLIELLLVMALLFIVSAFTAPVGISFYQSQVLNEVSEGLTMALRRAQTYSMSGKNDNSFGVYIFTGGYTLFEGPSYASRVTLNDETFSIPDTVDVLGFNEVLFAGVDGAPSEASTLSLTLGNKTRYVELTSAGNIEN